METFYKKPAAAQTWKVLLWSQNAPLFLICSFWGAWDYLLQAWPWGSTTQYKTISSSPEFYRDHFYFVHTLSQQLLWRAGVLLMLYYWYSNFISFSAHYSLRLSFWKWLKPSEDSDDVTSAVWASSYLCVCDQKPLPMLAVDGFVVEFFVIN